jgi:hypothetical protein
MKLSDKARKILNDPDYIAVRDRWFQKLEDISNQNVLAVNGFPAEIGDPGLIYSDPEAWVVECLEQLADKIDETRSDIMFKPMCIETALYGVH